ncbi:hypothetical protein IW261DRAFT_1516829 [Armillaria novae-zelandiae]|uniref:Uncharacterized protein n=1 Tax=Armillaria novae-zelandiae TaxID=153914 RepID=A0AA39NRM5_9AGAR|nr:hypothetical protein IW261DRAFT_1516829 [Armillaria novae-zelandiae]
MYQYHQWYALVVAAYGLFLGLQKRYLLLEGSVLFPVIVILGAQSVYTSDSYCDRLYLSTSSSIARNFLQSPGNRRLKISLAP